jgi:hypothetical protein
VIVFGSWDEGWTPQDTGFDTIRLRMKGCCVYVHHIVVLFKASAASGKYTGSQEFSFLAYIHTIF